MRSFGDRSEPRSGPWLRFGAWLALTGFYLLTRAGNHAEADDVFWFANDVETAPWKDLIDPAHTLYLPAMRLLWLGARGLGLADRAYPVMSGFGAAAAAAAVVLFGLLLRRNFSLSRRGSLLGMALLGLSYGFWRYAAEAEVYATAIAVLVLFLLVAFDPRPGRTLRGRLPIAAVLGALAVGVHILAVIPVLLSAPLLLATTGPRRDALAYLALCVLLLLGGAVVAHRLAAGPGQSTVQFVLDSSGDDPRSNPFTARQLLAAPLGLGQLLLASNFVTGHEAAYRTLSSTFPGRMLEDERVTATMAPPLSRALAPVTFALSLALLVAVALMTLVGLRGRLSDPSILPALSWLAAHTVAMGVFGTAVHNEAWFIGFLPVLLLISVVLAGPAAGPRAGRLLVAFAVAMAMHNAVAGMWPVQDRDSDRNYQMSEWLLRNATEGDLILTADSPHLARYLRYWTRAEVLDLQTVPAAAMDSVYRDRVGGTPGHVYATADLFDPPEYFRVLYPERADARDRLATELRDRVAVISDASTGTVYEVVEP